MSNREIARDTLEACTLKSCVLCSVRVHMVCGLSSEAKTACRKLVTPPNASLTTKFGSFLPVCTAVRERGSPRPNLHNMPRLADDRPARRSQAARQGLGLRSAPKAQTGGHSARIIVLRACSDTRTCGVAQGGARGALGRRIMDVCVCAAAAAGTAALAAVVMLLYVYHPTLRCDCRGLPLPKPAFQRTASGVIRAAA